MTLEQAIEFCLNMEKEQYKSAHNIIRGDYPEYEATQHFRLASEYKQLATWLQELKELKASGTKSVKRGRWIAQLNGHVLCSYCGKEQAFSSDFCKHCGADMRNEIK